MDFYGPVGFFPDTPSCKNSDDYIVNDVNSTIDVIVDEIEVFLLTLFIVNVKARRVTMQGRMIHVNSL